MSRPRTYSVPQTAAVDDGGRLTPPWHTYLTGLSEVATRVSTPIEPLAPSATLADVVAKLNEIIAALETARLMRTE